MRYSFRTKYLPGALGFICLFSGCINHEYDLSKEINKDITIGAGGISFPIGNTEEIRVSSLISESDAIKLENGFYTYRKKGDVEESIINIDPVRFSIDRFQVSPIRADFEVKEIPSFDTETPDIMRNAPVKDNLYLEAWLSTNGELELNEKIPSGFEVLHEVFAEKGSCVYLNVHLDFPEDFPGEVNELLLEDFEVHFPPFIRMNDPRVKDNVLYLNGLFDPHVGYQTKLEVIGMDFRMFNEGKGMIPVKENGESWLRIDSENKVALRGSIKTRIKNNSRAASLQNVIITPIISMEEITVGMVKGYIDPDFNTLEQSLRLELDEELDFLKEDATLDLYNPQIYLNVENPIGVPLDVELVLSARNDKTDELVTLAPIRIQVDPAEGGTLAASSRFLISRRGSQQEGCRTIHVPDLASLFHEIPDVVSVSLDAKANQETAHEIDLSPNADKRISADYEVVIPLHFETLELHYTESITGIKKELEKYADGQDSIVFELITDVLNSIPADLKLTVLAQDASGKAVKGITTGRCDVKAGVQGQSPVSTAATLEIEIAKDALPELATLELAIDGNVEQTPGGAALHEDQFVQLRNMRVKLLGGININFDKE